MQRKRIVVAALVAAFLNLALVAGAAFGHEKEKEKEKWKKEHPRRGKSTTASTTRTSGSRRA